MIGHYIHQLEQKDIGALINELNEQYYTTLLSLCDDATALTFRLRKADLNKTSDTEIYTVLCANFVSQVKRFMHHRKDVVLPYVQSLREKQMTNHDCSNCGHSCGATHRMHLENLKAHHAEAKDYLQQLKNVVIPLYRETAHPELYKELRIRMLEIEVALLECFFTEELLLIPGIANAQQQINYDAGNATGN